MSIQEWLNKNPLVTVAGAVVLLTISIGLLVFGSGLFSRAEPDTSDKFYFYDMKTQKLFAAKATLIPPIQAPSGGEGVLAEVYDCGSPDDRFVSLLRKYSPSAKRAIESGLPPSPSGDLIRLPDEDSKWVPVDSKLGQQMRLAAVAAARSRCRSGEPRRCFPK